MVAAHAQRAGDAGRGGARDPRAAHVAGVPPIAESEEWIAAKFIVGRAAVHRVVMDYA